MCSDPVTFGGGITIVNAGAPEELSAVNRPRSSQNRYRRPSTSAGAYCGESSAPSCPVTSRESSDVPVREARVAEPIQKTEHNQIGLYVVSGVDL